MTTTDTRELLKDQVDYIADQIANKILVMSDLEEIMENDHGGDYPESLGDWFNDVFDMSWEVARDLKTGKFKVRSVKVLVAVGGPNVWVTFNSNGKAEISGCWGGDRYSRYVDDYNDLFEEGENYFDCW